MNEKTVWMNAYETGYLSGIFPTRREADALNAALVREHGKENWQRNACLNFRLCWEDGQGMHSPPVEVHAEGGEA